MNIIGNLKSLHSLWVNLASNHRYQPYVAKSDIETFTRRYENEGLSFLTSVLPNIGKSLDCFHATTVWNAPDGFKTRRSSPIPLFLGGAIDKALAGDSLAVDCVRQLTYIFYKLEVDYDPEVVEKFLVSFRNTDHELSLLDFGENSNADLHHLIESMRRLIGRVLCNADPHDIRPYHGSGATACRTTNYDKWHKLRYYPRLDATFSYSDHFFYSPSHLIDEYFKLENAEESHPCARVVLVPKDSRGPRVISCEPAEYMYIQQGLMGKLYETLEAHPLTSGQINFIDQTINRQLAQHGSIHDDLATIDLSEASDRVSWALVQKVFPPNWVDAFEACRSPRTLLPDGTVVELNKFAPMGSSCCFPVEALVFWACAKASTRNFVSLLHPKKCDTNVYVYGDDIIIPSYLYDVVVKGLESIGLVVNAHKSFRSGPFRESCGGDYHKGYDVTPVRIRKAITDVGTGLATNSDLANLFLAKFGEIDSMPLIAIIESELGYVFPRSELCLPGTVRLRSRASNDVFFRRRWNKNLQRFEHRTLTLRTPLIKRRSPAWCELLRKELARERQRDNYSGSTRLFLTEKSIEPGVYADTHSVHKEWSWTWLG